MRRPLLSCAGALALILLAVEANGPISEAAHDPESSASTDSVDGTYVVLLRDQGTAPWAAAGRDSAPVASYRDGLLAGQEAVLSEIGSPVTLYRYTSAVDGFAAELTTEQVKKLQANPEVLLVSRSRVARLDHASPVARQAAVAHASITAARVPAGTPRQSDAGKGIVIGVVDSGIWPENPSFAAAPVDEARRHRLYPRFTGSCQSDGEHWSESSCAGKLLAAQSYAKGFGEDNIASAEFLSPRDPNGHGSHVAATAAGNDGVAVTVGRQTFGRVSGVAPAAALSIYKACWAAPDPADDGCTTVDTVRAIDQAVSDGVDVLNLSLSDSGASAADPVEIALLNAADAGVFVAASAGNDGPSRTSVAHPGPWVTTVAASTGASYPGFVELGDGTRLHGSMVSSRSVDSMPLVYAGDAAASGVDPGDAARCLPGSLDAAAVDDAIVMCDRGVTSRVAKGETVDQAGAVAMILANTGPAPVEADIHEIASIHVNAHSRRVIRDYLASVRRPTGSLEPTGSSGRAPAIADFSARGPVDSEDPDLIKPDLAATGVNVLAAVAPPTDFGRLWDLSSGTSMAAAQVSGAAAVVRATHRDWSPAAVKSALMTTARALPGDRGPLSSGAGQLRVRPATDPGLVFDSSSRSWWRYLRGQGVTRADGTAIADRSLEASNLNLASISIGSLVGEQTVTRRVTNVSDTTETYVGDVSGLRGVATRVTPPSITLAPGQSRSFRVIFSARKTARYSSFTTGALTWRGSHDHRVALPIAVRPDTVRTIDDVSGTGAKGDLRIRADAGVTGTLITDVIGPVAADPTTIALEPGSFDPTSPKSTSSSSVQRLIVPDDAVTARWEVNGDADVDLYAYRDGHLVAAAAGRTGGEQITIDDPPAGTYDVYVVAPDAESPDQVRAVFTAWAVSDDARSGSVRVTPARLDVTGTQRFGLDVSWNGLDVARRYLAAVTYEGSATRTLLTLN